MFRRFAFEDFGFGGVFKPIPVMMALPTNSIEFYVVFLRENSIFNLLSASLEFRDGARN